MGIQGHSVHCYKGWYWIDNERKESNPECLGLGLAHEVPRDPVKFKQWLEKSRNRFQKLLYEQGLGGFRPDADHPNYNNWVRRGPPEQGGEWMYTIDFDNLVFQINCQPFFRLDHMPSDELFLSSISADSYGRSAPFKSMPKEYWPVIRCNDLPVPAKEDLVFYSEHAADGHPLLIQELLRVSESARTRDDVRAAFVASAVGQYLKSYNATKTTLWLGKFGQRERVPLEVATAVHQLVCGGLRNPVIARREAHGIQIDRPFELNWFRSDVFSYFATQLQEEQPRYAAIAQVVRLVKHSNKRGVVFGVICSLLDIVILRVSVESEAVTFTHTPVMQFCPGQYSTSAITPGIAALARLSVIADPSFMIQKVNNLKTYPGPFVAPIRDQRCPTEVWIAIAQHLFQAQDLIALGCTSRQCQSAVAEILRDLAFPGVRMTSCVITDWGCTGPRTIGTRSRAVRFSRPVEWSSYGGPAWIRAPKATPRLFRCCR